LSAEGGRPALRPTEVPCLPTSRGRGARRQPGTAAGPPR
jgi:hypothetical protein